MNNRPVIDAVIRNLTVIDEAAHRLLQAFKDRCRPRPTRVFVVAVLHMAMVAAASTSVRASIHPALQETLSKLSPSDAVTALVILERQADVAALNQALRIQHATREERHRRVVETLRTMARESQAPLLAELDRSSRGGDVMGYTPYWITNLVVVRASRASIEEISRRADVLSVEPCLPPRLMDPWERRPASNSGNGARGIGVPPGLEAINAPRVWRELGINGSGTIVAVLDTGVDGNHPALHDRWRGNNGHPWQECWHDVVGPASQFPTDPMPHGTHVMGTLTGLGAATYDTIGVAWGAEWIAANAISQGTGSEFDHDVLDCLQWFADPDGNPNTVDDVPDVVQNSWGISELFGGGYSDCDMRWWAAIDNCEAAGVVLTWSVGGDGPGSGTVRSPADRATTATNCFSIGSIDATNYDFPYPIAPFSSHGPSGCAVAAPLDIKPEVVAPGVEIYSSVPGGGYQVWSGTAMSGPHVAGVVALMRSAEPDLDVDTIKEILLFTARDLGSVGEDNAYGWGVIDAYAAVVNLVPVTVPSTSGVSGEGLLTTRPNPVSRDTAIRFRTSADGAVTLAIHDVTGRAVRTILSERLLAGEHMAAWDSRDDAGTVLPTGVYFCRLEAEGLEGQARLVLAR